MPLHICTLSPHRPACHAIYIMQLSSPRGHSRAWISRHDHRPYALLHAEKKTRVYVRRLPVQMMEP
jgi:hypothetical protein